jgi:transcription factor C subunit 7
MPVTSIYILRHGHRLAWTLDPSTGRYYSSHPFPTGLPADPPLASHGVRQAQETGRHLSDLLAKEVREGRLRVYSSLFYRCLETLRPTVEALLNLVDGDVEKERCLQVRGERGVGEWFGHAWFIQPSPAPASRLRQEFFPWVDDQYESLVIPHNHGERIEGLHERVATALEAVVRDVDNEFVRLGRQREEVTVLICGHAAPIIASGRALTGNMPDDLDDEDFQCFTAGLSKFVRRRDEASSTTTSTSESEGERGVLGQWDCVLNSDCAHLSQGAERGWHFHGDESFDSYSAPGSMAIKVSDGGVGESKL